MPKRALLVAAALVGVTVIYLLGNNDPNAVDGENAGNTESECSFTVDADVLNVRADPSTNARVIGKVRDSDTVAAEATVRDGFRKLADEGWVSVDYLTPIGGASC